MAHCEECGIELEAGDVGFCAVCLDEEQEWIEDEEGDDDEEEDEEDE